RLISASLDKKLNFARMYEKIHRFFKSFAVYKLQGRFECLDIGTENFLSHGFDVIAFLNLLMDIFQRGYDIRSQGNFKRLKSFKADALAKTENGRFRKIQFIRNLI